MNLFQYSDVEEVTQMIMNSLETYKKYIIIHSEYQNKLSKRTVLDLLNALLVVTCFQQKSDHLISMVINDCLSFISINSIFNLFKFLLDFIDARK